MPANSRYEINNKGFAECAVGPEVKAAVLAIAEKAKAIAEGLSAEFAKTGNYADSFEVSEEITTLPSEQDKRQHPRASAVLENTASYAIFVEAGHMDETTGKVTEGHHVLKRTLEALEASD